MDTNRVAKLALSLVFMCAGAVTAAQEPLSQDEVLRQIYSNYDAKTKTAQWVCTEGQKRKIGTQEGWWCNAQDLAVTVELLQMSLVWEGNAAKTYAVASAKPPKDYDCHSCEPAVGVGVFVWKDLRWVLESANPAVGFYGEFGSPPSVDLINAGPDKYGVILSTGFGGQGYYSSRKALILPCGSTASEVWSIDDEEDNYGAYDPSGENGPKVRYRSWAALRFTPSEDERGQFREFYDLEVSSRGLDRRGPKASLRSENWTETYRFSDGKYKLISHKDFLEVEKPNSKPTK